MIDSDTVPGLRGLFLSLEVLALTCDELRSDARAVGMSSRDQLAVTLAIHDAVVSAWWLKAWTGRPQRGRA